MINIQHHGRQGAGTTRRWAGLTATLVSGALLLGACSSGSSDEPTTGAAGGSSDPAQVEEVTLTVWHYFSQDNQVAVMDGYKDSFEKSNLEVTVENVYVPYDQLPGKLVAAASAGEGPDVVVFNGGDAPNYVNSGVLVALDDYWATFEGKDQFPDGVGKRVNGSLFGVQGYVNLLGLYYNKDILDEIGVQPPTTIAELESAMESAKVAGYGGITLSGVPQGQGEWQAQPWLTSFGFNYGNLDEAALVKGYDMVKGWVDAGYLSQEAATWDQTVPFQVWAAGGIAFAANGNWQRGTADSTVEFEWGVTQLPIGNKGRVYLGGEGQGIGAFSENPDLAWKYLAETYLASEGQLLAMRLVGSIPTRTDVASLPETKENEFLSAFAATVSSSGSAYPPSEVDIDLIGDVYLLGGQAWSSVIGLAETPEKAAQTFLAELDRLINK